MLTNFTLLGGFARRMPAKKVQALIVILALAHPRAVSRQRLIDLPWGDADQGRARQSLRQALASARRLVGPVVRADRDQVALDMDNCRVDLIAFLEQIAASDSASLQRAVDLYHGPLVLADEIGNYAYALRRWRRSR